MISFDIYDGDGHLLMNRTLSAGYYRIGRGLGSDIRLKQSSIGRKHARLEVGHQRTTIRSETGPTGIHKDGEAINAYGPLKPGDVITIGDCQLHVLVGNELGAEDQEENRSSDADGRPAAQCGNDTEAPAARADGEGGSKAEGIDHVGEAAPEGPAPVRADSDIDPERVNVKNQLQSELVRSMDLYRRNIVESLSSDDLRREAREAVAALVETATVEVPERFERQPLIEEVVAEAIGYGPLEPLLNDPQITEVMVNGCSKVYIERGGRLEKTSVCFVNDQSLLRIIERIVTSVGRRIDESSPMVDARLPDGSRVNAIIPPLSLVGPSVTIRKFNQTKLGLDEMVDLGTLSANMVEFLRQCVLQRRNVVISGGTGSGKTTFLNATSSYIPEDERIVTIEDAAELKLHQEHLVPLEARPPNMEGKGAITIRDLVRNSLRMRPDRIIVGECRGGEALDMLQAMNTGHDGSLTTGHANSPRDLLSRLEVMVLMAGMDLPVRAIREQIASAIDVIVQQARFSDGKRRITSIVEVCGMEGDVILMNKLFEFRQRGVEPGGKIHGEFVGLGQAPTFYEELREAGVHLDTSIFGDPREEAMSHE